MYSLLEDEPCIEDEINLRDNVGKSPNNTMFVEIGSKRKGRVAHKPVAVEAHTLTNRNAKNKPPVPPTAKNKFVEPCIEDEVNLREIVDKSSSNTFVVEIGRKRKGKGVQKPVAVESHTLTNWNAKNKPLVPPTGLNKFVDVNRFSLLEDEPCIEDEVNLREIVEAIQCLLKLVGKEKAEVHIHQ